MPSSIQCLACEDSFWSLEEYERHRHRHHADDPDLGTVFHSSGRKRLA